MKNIKNYLHLYLGCEAIVKYPYSGEVERKMTIIAPVLHEFISEVEYCKPILRPLSDMTEKEAREFCIKEGWGENLSNIVVTDKAIDFKVDGHTTAVSRFTRCRPDMFIWLLSKGFDLFGLIDEGLAIDKSKVNTGG